jgi:hypothetical protein
VTALLFESAIMLNAMFISARWIIRRFEVNLLAARIAMGLVALGILLPPEIGGVRGKRFFATGISDEPYECLGGLSHCSCSCCSP